MTLSPTSWPGGGFNGGTITDPLVVDNDDGVTVEDAAGPAIALSAAATSATLSGGGLPGTGGFSVHGGAFGGAVSLQDSAGRSVGMQANGAQVVAQDGGGANLWGVLEAGAILTAAHVAPADIELAAGDCALWFDQTNGAAKLMVKAKQADGTVRTAAIALA